MANKTANGAGRKKAAQRASAGKKAANGRAGQAAPVPGAPASGASEEADGIEPADLSALKAGKLYYRIGEVSQITGVKPYVLRYWESEFKLMSPQKSRSKQRLYRQKDIETILAIKRLLYEERYTIAGARKRLREMGADARAELVAEIRGEGEPRAGGAGPQPASGYRHIRDELLQIRTLLAAELPA